jgi:DNA processing protein
VHSEELVYEIALTMVKGVGDITAKNLLTFCGSAKNIFTEKKKHFLKIPGIAEKTAEALYSNLHQKEVIARAEQEILWLKKENVEPVFFTSPEYPDRLRYCPDSPILLYKKGNANLNESKVLSVVGTRIPSKEGEEQVRKLISQLAGTGISVVSGLAYGIDILVHRACLEFEIPTLAVLAHGLHTIYPSLHSSTAKKMQQNGALLTEFRSYEKPDRENFPKRNRIVAGMCDALVVIETRRKGGSLITAEIANSYNKDIFAFPGRAGDELAEGCNYLIKSHKAALIESSEDLLEGMAWSKDLKPEEKSQKNKGQSQLLLLENFEENERNILIRLQHKSPLHVDEISFLCELSISKVVTALLQLEFCNIVKSLPGKMYALNN